MEVGLREIPLGVGMRLMERERVAGGVYVVGGRVGAEDQEAGWERDGLNAVGGAEVQDAG